MSHQNQAEQPQLAKLDCKTNLVNGPVTIPGSKSITNRALLLAALSVGRTQLTGCLVSDDTLYMSAALREMGVSISEVSSESMLVESNGKLAEPSNTLFVGNAGTAARFLTAACCLADGTVDITGDEYMQKRPIQPLIDALQAIGFNTACATGCLPVQLFGATSALSTKVEVDANMSTQYISALMMMAPLLPQGLHITLKGGASLASLDAIGYLDLTIQVMQDFGITVAKKDDGWLVPAGQYTPTTNATGYAVEADYSAATYFWAADYLSEGTVSITNAGSVSRSLQPDAKAFDVISQFPNMPAVIDGSQMQDSIPTLAVLAAFNNNPVTFVGIKNLRVKECDRIQAVYEGLNQIRNGLAVVEGDDLSVYGADSLISDNQTIEIDSFDDHRIAMSFALAAIRMPGITIKTPMCVAKTVPEYWQKMEEIGVNVEFT